MNAAVVDGAFIRALESLDFYIRGFMNGRFGGARKSRAYGNSPEFADYRDYTPGDDLRRIDWNLVGRFDKYYIKRFVDEKQTHTRVYIDTSASMDWDGGAKRFLALRLAAAMGFLSVCNMDMVTYGLLSASGCRELGGKAAGRADFYAAALKLSAITFGGSVDMESAIRSDPNPGYGDGLSIIISDFLTDSDWKKAADYLLSRHRQLALIQVLSPEELNPFYAGELCLCDGEAPQDDRTNAVRLNVDRAAVKAYAKALACFKADMERFCASRNVVFISASSDESVESVVLVKGYAKGLIK